MFKLNDLIKIQSINFFFLSTHIIFCFSFVLRVVMIINIIIFVRQVMSIQHLHSKKIFLLFYYFYVSCFFHLFILLQFFRAFQVLKTEAYAKNACVQNVKLSNILSFWFHYTHCSKFTHSRKFLVNIHKYNATYASRTIRKHNNFVLLKPRYPNIIIKILFLYYCS